MKVITVNRKVSQEYSVQESIEAGIVLTGDEIKSIRGGHVSLNDSFAVVHDSEIQLINCHIAPYSHAYSKVDRSRRTRNLLLHRKEINRLIGDVSRKGMTLVPLKLYFNDRGYVKVELGIAKHKKAVDRKKELKERDIKRETERAIKGRLK